MTIQELAKVVDLEKIAILSQIIAAGFLFWAWKTSNKKPSRKASKK